MYKLVNIKYTGKRKAQFSVSGKMRVVRPHDILEDVPEHDARMLVKRFNFRPLTVCDDEIIFNKTIKKSMYNPIRNLLEGKRCFVVGSGKSLTDEHLEMIKDEFTIALNHMTFLVPNCSAMLFLDKAFIENAEAKRNKNKERLMEFKGLIFCRDNTGYHEIDTRENVYPFKTHSQNIQAEIENGIFNGSLSGIAATNLAVALKAEKIYLLGQDSGRDKNDTYSDGRKIAKTYTQDNYIHRINSLFKKFLSLGDKIIDCTPTPYNRGVFEHVPLEEVLS